MPFQSEKQRRYLWANEPEIARDWADTYGSRIEKNDGGITRVNLKLGMSPGTAQARGIGAQHHGSTTSGDKTQGSEGNAPTKGFVPGIGYVGPQTQAQTDANKRARLLAERKAKKEKESIFKKIQRKAITWDLKKRLQKKYKSSTYDPEAAAYGIFDASTEELEGRIDRADLPFGDPDYYGQKDYTKDYPGIGGIFKGPNDRDNQALPNYYAPRDVHAGTGDDTTIDYDFNRDFQDSLTSPATTPDYYAGENPLASNLEWGKKMGVDPRTMGLTSFAANGGRIPAAFGGIMDTATGRRAYGLGSIFKSIGKAAKKVFKSPIGKAAILAGGFYYGGGSLPFFGSRAGATGFGSKGLGMKQLAGLLKGGGKEIDGVAKYAGAWNPWKVGIAATSLLPWMLPGPEEDDEGDKGSNYDVLRDKYASELMNIKRGLSAGSLNPDQWSYLPSDYTYTGAEGGRAGYYAGGQSIPSEYTIEDAMMTTTQDKLGGITDVMKQADLYRQGSVGQFYAADGGRIGFAHGMNEKLAELKKAYSTYVKGGGTLSYEKFSAAFAEENFAEGGRIGAEEGGLMDLGGMEKDYRNDGGFVPLGGEEKADDVPARLSKNEFVFTADAVRGAGGGDIDKGAEIMENIMKNLEQGGQISEETQGLSGAQEMFGVSERLSEVV